MQLEPILEDPVSHTRASYETVVPPSHSVTLDSPSEPPCKARDEMILTDLPLEDLPALKDTTEAACNDMSGIAVPPSDSVTLVYPSETPSVTGSETSPSNSTHKHLLIVEDIVKAASSVSTEMAVPPPPLPCTGHIRWIPYVKPKPPLCPRNMALIVLNVSCQK